MALMSLQTPESLFEEQRPGRQRLERLLYRLTFSNPTLESPYLGGKPQCFDQSVTWNLRDEVAAIFKVCFPILEDSLCFGSVVLCVDLVGDPQGHRTFSG